MPLINSWEVIKYIKASAGRTGINVVFEAVDKPRHDGTTIYLPKITASTTKDQLDQMMASTDHEVAHDLYSSFEVLKEVGTDASKSLLGFIFNVLEDDRVNTIESMDYEGFRILWDKCCGSLIKKAIPTLNSKTKKDSVFIRTLVYWVFTNNPQFPSVTDVVKAIKVDDEMLSIMNKFIDRLFEARTIIDKREGSTATYKLSEDLLNACGFDVEADKKKSKEEREELEAMLKSLSAALQSMHDKTYVNNAAESEKSPPAEEGTPSGISGSDMTEGSWCVNPHVEIEDIFKSTPDRGNDHFINWYKKYTKDSSTKEGFSQQIRRLIQIKSRSKYEYGVKKGKLDSARLSRICMSDAVGFNERIFKRKINSIVLDAAVTLLVDTSGSMSGAKYFNAVKSAILLNDSIGTALNIPVEVLGFTDSYNGDDSPIKMFIHKEFDVRRNEEDLIRSFAHASESMAGNPDGENILWAYQRLKGRKEKKKILIVFSDGSPAASRSQGGIFQFTKQVISEIENEKIVDIYGIGIEDESVKSLYTHQCTIKNSSEISEKLLTVIEQKLLTQ
jgi:hypothetical protein